MKNVLMCFSVILVVLLAGCPGTETTEPATYLVQAQTSPEGSFVTITDDDLAAVTDATVTMNDVTLAYSEGDEEYLSDTLSLNYGDTVTLVIDIGDVHIEASVDIPSVPPVITMPDDTTTWNAGDVNTVTWTIGDKIGRAHV